jgi:glycosyltransferase involved in cell wall biosynthesis
VDPDWLEATARLAREYAERTSRDGAPLRVLYAGLLGLPQGLDTLLRAAKLLERENVRFALAGDGPDAARLRQLARDLGLSKVEFLGQLDRDRLLEVYEQADVCYAQLRDGAGFATAYPTKLLEYMAAGRPVIYGGRGEAADDVRGIGCGLVVEPDRPEDFAQAARHLAADARRRIEMGGAGRRHVIAHRQHECVRATLASLCRGLV